MAVYEQSGVNIGNYGVHTATGTVKSTPGILLGFLCNSTSSGTIVIRDGGGSGTAITGTITPSAGSWYNLPVAFNTDLHITIANTLNVTMVYR